MFVGWPAKAKKERLASTHCLSPSSLIFFSSLSLSLCLQSHIQAGNNNGAVAGDAVVLADVLVGDANLKGGKDGRVVAGDNVAGAAVRCLPDVRVGEGAPQHAVAPRWHVDLDASGLLLLRSVLLTRAALVAVGGRESNRTLLKPVEDALRIARHLRAQLVRGQQLRPAPETDGGVRARTRAAANISSYQFLWATPAITSSSGKSRR